MSASIMEVGEIVRRIDEARSLLRSIREGTDIPQIARCVQLADMNLHWAKWNLGETDEIMPELEQ